MNTKEKLMMMGAVTVIFITAMDSSISNIRLRKENARLKRELEGTERNDKTDNCATDF